MKGGDRKQLGCLVRQSVGCHGGRVQGRQVKGVHLFRTEISQRSADVTWRVQQQFTARCVRLLTERKQKQEQLDHQFGLSKLYVQFCFEAMVKVNTWDMYTSALV